MKAKTPLLTIALLLGLNWSCQKLADHPPAPPTCQLQKITYNDGSYDTLIYNTDGFVTQSMSYYLDQTGKLASYGAHYSYTSQGLLEWVMPYGDGQIPSSDYYEQFTYVNQALSTIEITEAGKRVYRFEVTTNAMQQITGLTGVSFDQSAYRNYSAAHLLDAQGHYVKSEGTDANGLFYRQDLGDFDASINTYHRFLKGWPVNVMNYWYEYGLNTPINGNGAFLKRAFYNGYDATGAFVGLKKLYDVVHTYKTNNSQYATEMTTINSAAPPGTIGLTNYIYANYP